MSFLIARNISKQYENEHLALDNVSISLEKGKVISLIGESGSGKSTLLRILAGLENQDSGEVYLGEKVIQKPSERLVPDYDEVKLIHQDFSLYPNSTVKENIARPLLKYEKDYAEQRIEEILGLLNLDAHKDKFPRQLSGGQQQKVAIGRALGPEPELLLLDEPFSNLDIIQKRELIYELREIFEVLQMTVVFVTHDLDDALQLSDTLIVMGKGKILQEGNAAELNTRPNNLYVAKLFSPLNPIPGMENTFVRPSDLTLLKSNGIKCRVLVSQYLAQFNLLTVRLETSGDIWKVQDNQRRFEVGKILWLRYDEDKLLRF
ncbi:hypothetical protein P872_15185 [Rhodonellum psychrophilum GCM71 = DSM 17998]|uniref:ABC transporter domain-containing protein n=2 Tax=Rhodonellum TaxID=336827 RepID=U5C883_9BACT|nr:MULTISPECIES: ABC transporter ATP-binding protein [Rhodonellum]ERM84387.1 hypothetical protein P872_15185 [Rhodonellum psychrophilum GCM71 = DSM 17998]SDZ42311.1 iron(III) transport system ATP-binding protein [Rhodonellum ikkaensis]